MTPRYTFDGENVLRWSESIGLDEDGKPYPPLRISHSVTTCYNLLERFEALVEAGETWAIPHAEQLTKALEAYEEGRTND